MGCYRGRQRRALRLCQAPPDACPHIYGGTKGVHKRRSLRKLENREAAQHGRRPRLERVPGSQVSPRLEPVNDRR